jgi:hypothetical protein
LLDEAAFKESDMRLCQVLVLTYEEYDMVPEVLVEVTS